MGQASESYFQIAVEITTEQDTTVAEECLGAVVSKLDAMGLKMIVERLSPRDKLVVWNIKTPDMAKSSENRWMRKISRKCDKAGCCCRFRFPSFIESHAREN